MLAVYRRDAEKAEMEPNNMVRFSLSETNVKYMHLALNVSPTITRKTLRPQRLRGET